MLKGFWELCAAYRYDYKLEDMSRAAVVWLFLLLGGLIFVLVELLLWVIP